MWQELQFSMLPVYGRERGTSDEKRACLRVDGAYPEAGPVPCAGQEASCFVMGQWRENGEKVLLECEYEAAG